MIKLLPYILSDKKIFIFSIGNGNGQHREPSLCQLYRHTFVPHSPVHFTSPEMMLYKVTNKPVGGVGVDAAWLRQVLGDKNATTAAVKIGHLHAAPASISPVDMLRHPVHRQTVHLQQLYIHTHIHTNLYSGKTPARIRGAGTG